MTLRQGSRPTDIGPVPCDWDVGALKRFWTVLDCKHVTAEFVQDGFPVASINEVQSRIVDLRNAKKTTRQYYDLLVEGGRRPLPGDLIVSRNATVGQIAQVADWHPLFAMGQDVCLLRKTSPTFSTGFLQEVFQSQLVARQFANLMVGSTFKRVNVKQIRDLEVPMPPSHEQQAIATTLSDVDALLGALDQLIAKKHDLKQASMQQLLTGQIRLPGFVAKWATKRLREVADLNRSNVVPASQPNLPFVHFSLPAFDDRKSAQVELGATIGSNKFRVPPDAVLVSKLNPRIPRVWAPTHVPENACASTEWLVLTPREGTVREFLYRLCSAPSFCRQMELAATGTTGSHQRISPKTALDIRVALPIDQDEQAAIAGVVSDMDAEIAGLEQRRDKTRLLKQGMMQELLTGRTRLV